MEYLDLIIQRPNQNELVRAWIICDFVIRLNSFRVGKIFVPYQRCPRCTKECPDTTYGDAYSVFFESVGAPSFSQNIFWEVCRLYRARLITVCIHIGMLAFQYCVWITVLWRCLWFYLFTYLGFFGFCFVFFTFEGRCSLFIYFFTAVMGAAAVTVYNQKKTFRTVMTQTLRALVLLVWKLVDKLSCLSDCMTD